MTAATTKSPVTFAASTSKPEGPADRKLGLVLLSGIVISSMIGGGTFNLPQNMAQKAGLAAICIAWAMTLVGMYFLANSFRILADKRPDLKAGIYSYARAGFGSFAGFQMSWGYWLSSVFGNVAFAVLIMQILGYFFPIFATGQNWPSIIGASLLIWVMCGIVLLGVKRTALLNVMASVLNITSILAALVVMAFFVSGGMFAFDIWGRAGHLGSVFTQVKSTMLVTLWVFIGIEAAVVVSGRARSMSSVGPATFIGLGVCTVLYSVLSILPFGIMHQDALAKLANPSAAYVLQAVVGHWGAAFVNVSLLLSVLSCWLAWTILVAELPLEGAKGGVFPKFLANENRFHAPAPSLVVSSVAMQASLFVVLFAHNAWLWLVDITGVMILPPYFASTLYLSVYAANPAYVATHSESRRNALVTGILGSIYAAWLLYAAGAEFILMSTIIFSIGVPVFWWARHDHAPGEPVFTRREKIATFLLLTIGILSIGLFATGVISVT
ncbi:amino acid permease (plasmid) [Lichenicola cladoniae]|uniref:Amino acid permease n=1 Tax=Lichenicola cladoniae TaxID=1484109 RepID=A0A6M8HY50_9PROT|nr:basic amino acid/polyamine antiporter [Lichenicola cladoniae]NPD70194.1 amino acid permease [Acetobacteraceae bacterium]QKE93479.1 amino acid permease [Lichenicola cladoniae]